MKAENDGEMFQEELRKRVNPRIAHMEEAFSIDILDLFPGDKMLLNHERGKSIFSLVV